MFIDFGKHIAPHPAAAGTFATLHHGLPLQHRDFTPIPPLASPARTRQLVLKRALDIVLAITALLALAPLLLIIAALIKLFDPGPVLFRQPREGLGGTTFNIFKFRTMRPCPLYDDNARTTTLGRLLRRTSLDELPQLLNVITGDMALVGPRPHIPAMPVPGGCYQHLVPYYHYRLAMRPGITGWAQANGLRGPIPDRPAAFARIDHDLAYIQNFSLALDLHILFLTLRREFLTGTGH